MMKSKYSPDDVEVAKEILDGRKIQTACRIIIAILLAILAIFIAFNREHFLQIVITAVLVGSILFVYFLEASRNAVVSTTMSAARHIKEMNDELIKLKEDLQREREEKVSEE